MSWDKLSRWGILSLLSLAVLAAPASAQSGSDDSENYQDDPGWGDTATTPNGGTGFGAWAFTADGGGDGFAGNFYEDPNQGRPENARASDNSSWGTFANGGDNTDQAAAAFRPFTTALGAAGNTFGVTFEHGIVEPDGRAGFTLRNGNAALVTSDVDVDARLKFYMGPTFDLAPGNYLIEDANGIFDTGIPSTTAGVDVEVTLTGADTYDVTVIRYTTDKSIDGGTPDAPYLVSGRTLAGSGTLDSLALFQESTNPHEGPVQQGDAFFNKVAYSIAAGGGGSDNASDAVYHPGGEPDWGFGTNGGSGFGAWEFATNQTSGGFAGNYLSNDDDRVDNIGTDSGGAPTAPQGAAWATFANKGEGIDRSTQFRDFSTPLQAAGDSFSVSYEIPDSVATGGQIGIALRDAPVDIVNGELPEDHARGARFQILFEGGDSNFSLVDGAGQVELDGSGSLPAVPYTKFGVDVEVMLTGPDTYDLKLTRYDAANQSGGTLGADLTGDGAVTGDDFLLGQQNSGTFGTYLPDFESQYGGSGATVFDKTTHAGLGDRTLVGSGSIESFTFFSFDDAVIVPELGQQDVFFNFLRYDAGGGVGTASVPEPASASMALVFGFAALARRRSRR
ncbi:hypothetical protein OAS39_06860 [Pirellulales bacterium]|nr:hypothetical protein [Pirellulales bacterium]